jgi:hypothetical protein
MDGPYARLEGENVNHDIMDRKRFDCFGTSMSLYTPPGLLIRL